MQRKLRVVVNNRDDIIKYALINEMSMEELQLMLTENGFRKLYARIYRDCVFIWAIYHKKTIETVNEELKKMNYIKL